MRKISTLYIFNTNLEGCCDLGLGKKDGVGLWFDGKSDLLNGLENYLDPEEVFVEENISENVIGTGIIDRKKVKIFTSANVGESTSYKPVCIYPANDTHVQSIKNIVNNLPESDWKVRVLKNKGEGACEALEDEGIPYSFFTNSIQEKKECGALLLLTDWGYSEIHILRKFQEAAVPVVCLQESIIDFGDDLRRMEWCNIPLIQGVVTVKSLMREIYFLTGNPRYEKLHVKDLPEKKLALINVNFTYGIHEDIRQRWLSDVIEGCKRNGFEYWITQHPRDKSDLSGYPHAPSGSKEIHKAIEDSNILISRFSSLIHESIALGRPVIYYNPHGEKMDYDFEPDGTILSEAKSAIALNQVLGRLGSGDQKINKDGIRRYVNKHMGSYDGCVTNRIIQGLRIASATPGGLVRRINPIQKIKYNMHFLKNV